jgi:ferredoxin
MTFVVTDNCQRCRFTDCVTVCPVACFHGDSEMLYIDNETCIDCGACVPLCPVHAIYEEYDLPDEKRGWIEINAEKATGLPVVDEKGEPLPTAEARKQELGY